MAHEPYPPRPHCRLHAIAPPRRGPLRGAAPGLSACAWPATPDYYARRGVGRGCRHGLACIIMHMCMFSDVAWIT